MVDDTDDSDGEFDLLAPQRKMAGSSASTRMRTSNKTKISRLKQCSIDSNYTNLIATLGTVSDCPLENRASDRDKEQTLDLLWLVLNKKCPLHTMLSPRSLVRLASTSSSLWRHFCDLRFRFCMNFSDLSRVLSVGKGFGVLRGGSLVVGTDDENIISDDLVAVTRMLQSPKTQLDITFVELNAHISREVEDSPVLEFIRSFRFPPLLALTCISLEGSVIGPKGITHLCSVLRQKCLPNLSELNLSRNALLSNGINCLNQTLCIAECCPLLQKLSVASNRAELTVVEMLCGQLLLARPNLICLDVSDNNICLADGNAIVTMKSNKPRLNNLTSLDLSFNPSEDAGVLALLSSTWPIPAPHNPHTCLLHLFLVNCNIGNKAIAYLGNLLKSKYFQHLETLSLGMNDGQGPTGIGELVDAMCPLQSRVESENSFPPDSTPVLSLKHFLVPLNNFRDEGMQVIMRAALRGGFNHLETLDISDIGASTDSMSTFISSFTQHSPCSKLKKLVVFGRHPFAQRAMRNSNFPQSFLSRVKVS